MPVTDAARGPQVARANDLWTLGEMAIAARSYFDLLEAEIHGQHVVKRAHVQALMEQLPARSRGSILRDLGFQWATGYAPYANVRADLRKIVEDELARRPEVGASLRSIK